MKRLAKRFAVLIFILIASIGAILLRIVVQVLNLITSVIAALNVLLHAIGLLLDFIEFLFKALSGVCEEGLLFIKDVLKDSLGDKEENADKE